MANKYRYPKGHPKAGQFQPAKEGAKQFVRDNFDKIAAGKVSVKNLSPTEKRIYAGLKGSDFGNRYTYGKQKFYDPTGKLKNIIEPVTKGKRDLKNFFDRETITNFLDTSLQFADPENRQTFIKGYLSDLKKFQKKNGALLDVVKMVERYSKRGYNLLVIDRDGEQQPNVYGVQSLVDFENTMLEKAIKTAKKKQRTANPFIRLRINYTPKVNVLKKTITIDLNDINTNLSDPKNTDIEDLSNS
jgi:hypothetical protein